MTPDLQHMTVEDARRAAVLWASGRDTRSIAEALLIPEAIVAKNLDEIRRVAGAMRAGVEVTA